MVNYSDKTLDKKHNKILNRYDPIKFKDCVEIKKIEDIFDKLFNNSIQTFNLDNTIHCKRNRGRSYYDCYLLCRNYFPEITFKDMYRKLYSLIENQNNNHKKQSWWNPQNKPGFITCSVIGRSRFIGKLKL